MMGGSALVRFIAIPESQDLKVKTAFCDQCKPHIFLKFDMEELFNDENGNFLEMVDAMIKEDPAEPTTSSQWTTFTTKGGARTLARILSRSRKTSHRNLAN